MNSNSLLSTLVKIRSNKVFELTVIAVIIGSALLIGAKTFDLSETTEIIVGWLDIAVTVFFLVEITVRFIADENKRTFFKDPWNLFDTLVVAISLVPVSQADTALVARLVRVFRVFRMVSIIPELRMLLNSLIKALPQLGYVLLLMFIIFYVYAAIGATLFAAINPDLWGDVAVSMLTLIRVMTFEDWTDVMYETMTVYSLSWIYYLSFIFLTAFAFLNMVIGIVVNVMNEEHERILKEEAVEANEPTIADLQKQLAELKEMLKQRAN